MSAPPLLIRIGLSSIIDYYEIGLEKLFLYNEMMDFTQLAIFIETIIHIDTDSS